MIARIVPGYQPIGAIDRTRQEFQVHGRILHEARFPTPTGRAHFAVERLPTLAATENQLRLMTVRSEGQFNTVVYEEADIYRGQERRDVILMNPSDISRFGLRVDQRVIVRSTVGEMAGILVRAYDIRAGNALMYYPEANVLVPATTDALSKTPAFKCVPITVEPDSAPGANGSLRADHASGRKPLPVVPG